MTAHARLGPSDSARWLSCPGSINFTSNYRNESSSFADEGTVAHAVREECLRFGFDAYDYIGKAMLLGKNKVPWVVDEEMADALQPGIDEINSFEGELFVEKRLDLSRWMPGQFGTLDAGVAGQELIVISDLKYGKGVPVAAHKNSQQMIYALGFWDQHARHITDAKKFMIIIDQPRHQAGGGYYETTLDELLAFGEELTEKAKATLDPNAPLIPTLKGCQWCPAANLPGRKGGCPAHSKWVAEQIELDFDELDALAEAGKEWQPPLVSGMTPEQMIRVSLARSMVEKWLEFVHAQALEYLVKFGRTAGYKAVPGRRPPRRWTDAIAAQEYLSKTLPSHDPFTKKVKTVAQAEKEIGKGAEIPESLVERGQPKPIMVPEDDSREAISTIDDEFDEEELTI